MGYLKIKPKFVMGPTYVPSCGGATRKIDLPYAVKGISLSVQICRVLKKNAPTLQLQSKVQILYSGVIVDWRLLHVGQAVTAK